MNLTNLKKLITGKRTISGRNSFGFITVYHRGGSHKKLYRVIDMFSKLRNVPGQIKTIEYDPNRSTFISLIYFLNGILCYRIACEGSKIGDILINSDNPIEKNTSFSGNNYIMKNILLGTTLHLVNKDYGLKAIFARSAGSYVLLIRRSLFSSIIKLRSGVEYKISNNSTGNLGTASNSTHYLKKNKKAGQTRWLGIRPTVRGEAKNPVDHPHGGRTRGGRPDVSPWGKITKGKKTKKKYVKI